MLLLPSSLCFDVLSPPVLCVPAGGAGDTGGGALGHENSVGVGLAEQQLHSAMQQLGMSDGESGGAAEGQGVVMHYWTSAQLELQEAAPAIH